MGFLIDNLHKDCSPLQFLRELSKNSVEAILRNPDKSGEIRWDLDSVQFALSDERASKLCIIDDGVGMTGEEMVKYINHLSSSFHKAVQKRELRSRGQDLGYPNQSRRTDLPELG